MKNWLKHWWNRRWVSSTVIGLLLLFLALVVNFYAGVYANERASNYVNDIVLNNIPVFDVDMIFVYGPFVLWLFVAWLAGRQPNRVPFILKSVALFILVRSAFITLTHIGPFPDHTLIDYSSDLVKKFTFGGDLFFSAHTGLPFLMALLFWDYFYWRIFFIFSAIFFGVIVLLGHLHYSIDVLSAFFITFTIFHLAKNIFKQDWSMFNNYT